MRRFFFFERVFWRRSKLLRRVGLALVFCNFWGLGASFASGETEAEKTFTQGAYTLDFSASHSLDFLEDFLEKIKKFLEKHEEASAFNSPDLERLKKFLGTDGFFMTEGDQDLSIRNILESLINTSADLENVLTNGTEDTLGKEGFQAAWDGFVLPFKNLASLLNCYYQILVEGKTQETLIPLIIEPVEKHFSDLPGILQSILQSLAGMPALPPLHPKPTPGIIETIHNLFDVIINLNNAEVSHEIIKLQPALSAFSEKLASLAQTFSTSSSFAAHPDGAAIDSGMKDIFDSFQEKFADLAGNLLHQSCLSESIDSLARIETFLSLIADGMGEFNTAAFEERTEASTEATKTALIAIVESLKSMKEATVSMRTQDFGGEKCIVTTTTRQSLNTIALQVEEILNQSKNIYSARTGTDTVLPAAAPNLDEPLSAVPTLIGRISLSIRNISSRLDAVWTNFSAEYSGLGDEDAKHALESLEEQFKLISFGVQDLTNENGKLDLRLSELGFPEDLFCEHKSVLGREKLPNFIEALSTFPFLSFSNCCEETCKKMEALHNALFLVKELFLIAADTPEAYTWEAHQDWIDILNKITAIFQTIASEEIEPRQATDISCHANRWWNLLDVLKEALYAAPAENSLVKTLLSMIPAPKHPSLEDLYPFSYKNNCSSCATMRDNIAEFISDFGAIIVKISKKAEESDYALDTSLQDALTTLLASFNPATAKLRTLPSVDDLCSTCHALEKNYLNDIADLIEETEDRENLYTKIAALSEQLKTPLCCHHSYEHVAAINQSIGLLTEYFNALTGGLPASSLPMGEESNVLFYFKMLADAFATSPHSMKNNIEKMKDIAALHAFGGGTENPCLNQHFIPFFSEIKDQFRNITIDVRSLLNLLMGEMPPPPPAFVCPHLPGSSYCDLLTETYSTLATSLSDLSLGIGNFNTVLEGKRSFFFSTTLYEYLETIQQAFKDMETYLKFLGENASGACSHQPKALAPKQIGAAAEELATAFSQTVEIFARACCRGVSAEFQTTNYYLQNLISNLTAVSDVYEESTLREPLPETKLALFELLSENATTECEQLKNIFSKINEILGATQPAAPCRFFTLAEPLRQFNKGLQKDLETLGTLFPDLVSTVAAPIVLGEENPCETLPSHIFDLVQTYETLGNTFVTWAKILRRTPPIRAKDERIFAVVEGFSQVFSAREADEGLGCILKKMQECFREGGSEDPKDGCRSCSKFSWERYAIDDISEKIKAAGEEIKDVLSKPGCCAYYADEVLKIYDSFVYNAQLLQSLSDLEQIALHPSRREVVQILFQELQEHMRTLAEGVALLVSNLQNVYSSSDEPCLRVPLTADLKTINEHLTHALSLFAKIVQELGVRNLPAFAASVPPRRIVGSDQEKLSGCEFFADVLDKWHQYIDAFKSTTQPQFIEALLRASERFYHPEISGSIRFLSEQFLSITENLKSYSENIQRILDDPTQEMCRHCEDGTIYTRNTPLLRDSLTHLSNGFENVNIALGSLDAKSILSTLIQYESSQALSLTYKIAQNIDFIGQALEGMASLDVGSVLPPPHDIYDFLACIRDIFNLFPDFSAPEASATPGQKKQYIAALKKYLRDVTAFKHKITEAVRFMRKDDTFLLNKNDFVPQIPIVTNFYNAEESVADAFVQALSRGAAALEGFAEKMRNCDVAYPENTQIIQYLRSLNWEPFLGVFIHSPFTSAAFAPLEKSRRTLAKIFASILALLSEPTCCATAAFTENFTKMSLLLTNIQRLFAIAKEAPEVFFQAPEDILEPFFEGEKSFLEAFAAFSSQSSQEVYLGNTNTECPLQVLWPSFFGLIEKLETLRDTLEIVLDEAHMRLLDLGSAEVAPREKMPKTFQDLQDMFDSFGDFLKIFSTFTNGNFTLPQNKETFSAFVNFKNILGKSVQNLNSLALFFQTREEAEEQEDHARKEHSYHYLGDVFAHISQTFQTSRKDIHDVIAHLKAAYHLDTLHSLHFLAYNLSHLADVFQKTVINNNLFVKYLLKLGNRDSFLISFGQDEEEDPGFLLFLNHQLEEFLRLLMNSAHVSPAKVSTFYSKVAESLRESTESLASFYRNRKYDILPLDETPYVKSVVPFNESVTKILQTLERIVTIWDSFKDLLVQYTYNKKPESLFADIERMYTFLDALLSKLEKLALIKEEKFVEKTWSRKQIHALISILRALKNNLVIPVVVRSCCLPLAQGLGTYQQQFKQLQKAQTIFLTNFSTLLPDSLERARLFCPVDGVQPLVEEFSAVYASMASGLSAMLSVAKTSSTHTEDEPYCLSTDCEFLIKGLSKELSRKLVRIFSLLQETFPTNTLKMFPTILSADKSEPLQQLQKISEDFSEGFSPWTVFETALKQARLLEGHFPLGMQLQALFKEANRFSQALSRCLTGGLSSLCSACCQEVMPALEMKDFKATQTRIIVALNNHCTSILQHVFGALQNRLAHVNPLLKQKKDEVRVSFLGELATAFTNLATTVGKVETTPKTLLCCVSQKFNPVFLEIDSRLQALFHLFTNREETSQESTVTPLTHDNFVTTLKAFSSAWDSFCNQPLEDSPSLPTLPSVQKLISSLELLEKNVKAACLAFKDVPFCGNLQFFKVLPVREILNQVVLNLKNRTVKWLSVLETPHCCGSRASCLQTLVTAHEHVFNLVKEMPVLKKFKMLHLFFRELQAELVTFRAEFLAVRNQVSRKELHTLADVSYQHFQAKTANTLKNVFSEAGDALPPKDLTWEEFHRAEDNDCDNIPHLYNGLTDSARALMTLLPQKLPPFADSETALFFDLKNVQGSLRELNQTLQSLQSLGRDLCHGNQVYEIQNQMSRVFELSANALDLVTKSALQETVEAAHRRHIAFANQVLGHPANPNIDPAFVQRPHIERVLKALDGAGNAAAVADDQSKIRKEEAV